MATNLRVDGKGIEQVLASAAVAAAVRAAADDVASNVEALGIRVGDRDGGRREYALPVSVRSETTDRARASVQLAHPAGLAVQAKHGALTKAAGQAGLDVVVQ